MFQLIENNTHVLPYTGTSHTFVAINRNITDSKQGTLSRCSDLSSFLASYNLTGCTDLARSALSALSALSTPDLTREGHGDGEPHFPFPYFSFFFFFSYPSSNHLNVLLYAISIISNSPFSYITVIDLLL